MEPRRNPARRGGLIALAALLVFGASACSGGTGLVGTPPAATVNGETISQADVDQMVTGSRTFLESQIADAREGVGEAESADLESRIEQARAPFIEGTATYPTEGAALALTELITQEIYLEAVELGGGEVTAEDRAQAESELDGRDPAFADAPQVVRDVYISIGAANYALQRRVPEELNTALAQAGSAYEAQLREVYEQEQDSFRQACGFVLRASDEASAVAAADRVRGGEDAAAVSAELAGPDVEAPTEPQCFAVQGLTQAFGGDVEIVEGAVLGPIDDSGAFVAVAVESVGVQPFDEARATIAQSVQDQFTAQAQADIDAYIQDLVGRSADVVVDPRFGTWDADALQVLPPVPPADPNATTTTEPALVIPGS